MIVGVEKAYIALQTVDTAAALTYAAPAYYEGVKEIGAKPKQNTEKLYAENKLWDQATSFDSCDVALKLADMTSAQRAELLGQTIASLGGVYAKDTDVAPYVALLYKATLRSGYRYGVFYKGVFGLPDDSMKGQEGKTEFQVPVMNAMFQPTIKNGMWEYHVDTTDPNCPAGIADTWFTAVAIPAADAVAPTVTVVPVDAAANVAVNTTITWTFSKAIVAALAAAANFFVMKADGAAVAGALTIDATNKIVTFTPSANLTAATGYIAIATTSVKSASGVALAAVSVTNFTTAA